MWDRQYTSVDKFAIFCRVSAPQLKTHSLCSSIKVASLKTGNCFLILISHSEPETETKGYAALIALKKIFEKKIDMLSVEKETLKSRYNIYLKII